MQSKIDPRVLALIVASAQFMAALDSAVIAIAVPHMAHDFNTSPVSLSIGITAYMLTQAALLPSCSWVADRFGARTVFVCAIIGFIIASMLCGISRTLPEFIAARVLQGASGAMMTPVGRILVFQSVEKKDLVSVVNIGVVPMLFAPALGPPLGGFIVSYLSWPWIFFLNVPVGIGVTIFALRLIPNLAPKNARPFDMKGFLLTGVSVVGLIYGLHAMSEGASHWALAGVIFGVGVVASILAIRHIRTHPTPLISFDAMRHPNYKTSRLAAPLAQAPFQALNFILPLMLQVALGFSPLMSGVLILAMSAGDLSLKPFVKQIYRMYGFRPVIMSLIPAFAASVAACTFFAHQSPAWLIFAILFVHGMIRSVLFNAIITVSFTDVPQEEMSSASVLNSITMQLSGATSISLTAFVMNLGTAFKTGPHMVTLGDCRLAIIAATLICLASALGFRKLAPAAGAAVSGHVPRTRAAAGAAAVGE